MSILKPPLVIIGGGGAAVHAIKAIRQKGYSGEVQLFTDSVQPPYNPMLLTYYIGGKIPLEQCYIMGNNFDFYKNNNVTLSMGMKVEKLNPQEKTITDSNGRKLEYTSCLVASGASPLVPPVPGVNCKSVFTVRTIEEAIRLRQRFMNNPKKVVIVGASMVGIKLVEIFNEIGSQVYLVDLAPHIFPQAAHSSSADIMENELRKRGVELFFNTKVESIEESAGQLRVLFSDSGPELDADLLVYCIGVKPNFGFIDPASLKIDRGIIVDERMQAGEGVYAAGDVVQSLNLLNGKKEVIALWANACYQGQIAGANMAGAETVYPGSIPQNITHFFNIFFAGIGDVHHYDEIKEEQTSGGYSCLFTKNGQFRGANLLTIGHDDQMNQIGKLRYQIWRELHKINRGLPGQGQYGDFYRYNALFGTEG